MQKANLSIKESSTYGSVSVSNIAKSIGFCYAFTIILLAIFAVIVTYMPVSEGIVPTVVLLITILSIVLSGYLVARTIKSRGWFCGAVSGITYIVTLYVIGSLIFQSFSFGTGIVTMIIIGALSGALGGIIGVNVNSRR